MKRMQREEKIKEILRENLCGTRLGRYLSTNEENPIAPDMPTGVPLEIVGEGMGSKHITYNSVSGWSEVGEDDRYVILSLPRQLRHGQVEGESRCYAMLHKHPWKAFGEIDEYLVDRIAEDIMVDCNIDDEDEGYY
jgi:hypothetical protein